MKFLPRVPRVLVSAAVWAAAWPALGVTAGAAASPDVTGTELQYQAYVAGAPVGSAQVFVAMLDGEYRVQGLATSSSWLSAFSEWRNRFRAHGRLEEGVLAPGEFAYVERSGRSHRDVAVRDGTLTEIKNGRRRPPRPSPAGMDVVSALFVAPDCADDLKLHTGRHQYRLTLLDGDDAGCRFSVADEDGNAHEVVLTFGERHGLRVPQRITVHAWVTGWVELLPAD